MNKKRLEDVRETMAYIKMCESKEMHNQEQADMAKCYLIERHGDWLIEQAERVEELEENNRTFRKNNKRLRKENKCYREAIEKAIGGCRYTNPEVAYILGQALEGEE